MMIRLVAVLVGVACSAGAQDFDENELQDQENRTAVLGGEHPFSLTSPAGWVLDVAGGASQGVNAVFYPRGSSWQRSPSVMYAKSTSKRRRGNLTMPGFIARDSVQYSQKYPSMKIEHLAALRTRQGQKAVVRKYVHSQHEAIAYIDEQSIVVMLVLTARTKKAFGEAYEAFETLVASYAYVTESRAPKTTGFAAALRMAEDNLALSIGELYDERFQDEASRLLVKASTSCTAGLDRSELQPFTIVVRIGASGRAEQVLTQPETKLAACVESMFRAAAYPKPPDASWWVRMKVLLSDE